MNHLSTVDHCSGNNAAGEHTGLPEYMAGNTGTTDSAAPGHGLVTCAISSPTVRPAETRAVPHLFAGRDDLQRALSPLGKFSPRETGEPLRRYRHMREGATPTIQIAPGLVRMTWPDYNRREQRLNRDADRPGIVALDVDGDGEETTARGEITGWSRRSRARMIATIAELDLAPLFMAGEEVAMLTLTYPGDWQTVVPDGETFKRHMAAFFKRWEKAWGMPPALVWKMEFQRRGAPHLHALVGIPSGVAYAEQIARHETEVAMWELAGRVGRRPLRRTAIGEGLPFRSWVSLAWADIVGHPDPEERRRHELAGTAVDTEEGDRARDPKRAAVYFGKHGMFADKEYQHDVPELWKQSGKSVGRFWGYKGLQKTIVGTDLQPATAIAVGRMLRRLNARVRAWDRETGAVIYRPPLRTVYRPRYFIRPDGTFKPERDRETGMPVLDVDGHEVPKMKLRRQTVKSRRMTGNNATGFVLVNDVPHLMQDIVRLVADIERPTSSRLPVGMRGTASARLYR